MGRRDYVKIEDCTLLKETDRALLFEKDGYQEWIPRSLISDGKVEFGEKETGNVLVEQWKADDLGWDYEE